MFADYYGINDIGYWEHDNYVLMRNENISEILLQHQLKATELESDLTRKQDIRIKLSQLEANLKDQIRTPASSDFDSKKDVTP